VAEKRPLQLPEHAVLRPRERVVLLLPEARPRMRLKLRAAVVRVADKAENGIGPTPSRLKA
jgi:hypothetical protein